MELISPESLNIPIVSFNEKKPTVRMDIPAKPTNPATNSSTSMSTPTPIPSSTPQAAAPPMLDLILDPDPDHSAHPHHNQYGGSSNNTPCPPNTAAESLVTDGSWPKAGDPRGSSASKDLEMLNEFIAEAKRLINLKLHVHESVAIRRSGMTLGLLSEIETRELRGESETGRPPSINGINLASLSGLVPQSHPPATTTSGPVAQTLNDNGLSGLNLAFPPSWGNDLVSDPHEQTGTREFQDTMTLPEPPGDNLSGSEAYSELIAEQQKKSSIPISTMTAVALSSDTNWLAAPTVQISGTKVITPSTASFANGTPSVSVPTANASSGSEALTILPSRSHGVRFHGTSTRSTGNDPLNLTVNLAGLYDSSLEMRSVSEEPVFGNSPNGPQAQHFSSPSMNLDASYNQARASSMNYTGLKVLDDKKEAREVEMQVSEFLFADKQVQQCVINLSELGASLAASFKYYQKLESKTIRDWEKKMTQWRNDNVEPNMSDTWHLPESPGTPFLSFPDANEHPPPAAVNLRSINKAWSTPNLEIPEDYFFSEEDHARLRPLGTVDLSYGLGYGMGGLGDGMSTPAPMENALGGGWGAAFNGQNDANVALSGAAQNADGSARRTGIITAEHEPPKFDRLKIELEMAEKLDFQALERDYACLYESRTTSENVKKSKVAVAAGEFYRTAEEATCRWNRDDKVYARGGFSYVELIEEKVEPFRKAVVKILEKNVPLYSEKNVAREIFTLRILGMAGGHPNICRMYEVYEDQKKVYIILERLEGGDLFSHIHEQGFYTEQSAAELIREMLRAVLFCHRLNIAHRDLKPENFVYAKKAEKSNLKLIDFGLSFYSEEVDMLTKTLAGTPEYLAPEVFYGQGYVGTESDMWALGVITYILLSGSLPFDEPDTKTLVKKIKYEAVMFEGRSWVAISEPAKHFVSRLLSKDPTVRMTASEALTHPWISDTSTLNRNDLLLNVQKNILAFQQKRRWKAAIHAVQARNRMMLLHTLVFEQSQQEQEQEHASEYTTSPVEPFKTDEDSSLPARRNNSRHEPKSLPKKNDIQKRIVENRAMTEMQTRQKLFTQHLRTKNNPNALRFPPRGLTTTTNLADKDGAYPTLSSMGAGGSPIQHASGPDKLPHENSKKARIKLSHVSPPLRGLGTGWTNMVSGDSSSKSAQPQTAGSSADAVPVAGIVNLRSRSESKDHSRDLEGSHRRAYSRSSKHNSKQPSDASLRVSHRPDRISQARDDLAGPLASSGSASAQDFGTQKSKNSESSEQQQSHSFDKKESGSVFGKLGQKESKGSIGGGATGLFKSLASTTSFTAFNFHGSGAGSAEASGSVESSTNARSITSTASAKTPSRSMISSRSTPNALSSHLDEDEPGFKTDEGNDSKNSSFHSSGLLSLAKGFIKTHIKKDKSSSRGSSTTLSEK